jgi:hypothetical protein
LAGSLAKLIETGTCTIEAKQAGTDAFAEAPTVTHCERELCNVRNGAHDLCASSSSEPLHDSMLDPALTRRPTPPQGNQAHYCALNE